MNLETVGFKTFTNPKFFGTRAKVVTHTGYRALSGIYDDDYYQYRFGQASEVNGRYHSLYVADNDLDCIEPGVVIELHREAIEYFTVVRIESDSGGMSYIIMTPGIDNDPD